MAKKLCLILKVLHKRHLWWPQLLNFGALVDWMPIYFGSLVSQKLTQSMENCPNRSKWHHQVTLLWSLCAELRAYRKILPVMFRQEIGQARFWSFLFEPNLSQMLLNENPEICELLKFQSHFELIVLDRK